MSYKELYEKYKNFIPYIIFGVLTTIVNILTYWIAAHLFGFPVMPSTILAWMAAVLFAYFTNREWVFQSKAHSTAEVAKEVSVFFACRLATGVIDWLCMFVFVTLLQFDDVFVKAAANILVILLNYMASRLIIFR
jgi:putative flippase GtrA